LKNKFFAASVCFFVPKNNEEGSFFREMESKSIVFKGQIYKLKKGYNLPKAFNIFAAQNTIFSATNDFGRFFNE
jgi:hypothetical protein